MADLPTLALSIRQPWAWAILHAGKRIENRSWQAVSRGLSHRGPFCIHAASGMTRAEYESARAFIFKASGIQAPLPFGLDRGGIIGVASVVDIVTDSDDPWFMGARGLVLDDVRPVEFIPCRGMLGFFTWSRADDFTVEPERWTRRWGQSGTEPSPLPLLPEAS